MSSKEQGEITFLLLCCFLKEEMLFVSSGGGDGERTPGGGYSLAKMTIIESLGQNRNL